MRTLETQTEINNMPPEIIFYIGTAFMPRNYIVPMKRYSNNDYTYVKVIIFAQSPLQAMYLAKEQFEYDGWIIDENYQDYKII